MRRCRFHVKFFDSVLLGYILHASKLPWVEECLKKTLKSTQVDFLDANIAAAKKKLKDRPDLEKVLGKGKAAAVVDKHTQVCSILHLTSHTSAFVLLFGPKQCRTI